MKNYLTRIIALSMSIGLLVGLLSVVLMNRGRWPYIGQSPATETVATHAVGPAVQASSPDSVPVPETAMAPSRPVERASAADAVLNLTAPVVEHARAVSAPADALETLALQADALPAGVSMPERIPPVEECLPLVRPEIRNSYEVFVRQYPGVDPTETQDFHKALLDERFSYGCEVPEKSWQEYVEWVREMENMQQELVHVRGELAGLPLHGTDALGREYLLAGFEGTQPSYYFTTT